MNINDLFFFMLISATLSMIYISYYSWQRRNVPLGMSCCALMTAASFYTFGYAFELTSSNLEQIKFWLKVEYIGIPFIPVLGLNLALKYTGYGKYFKRTLMSFMFIIPVITFFFHYTNDFHHLFYKNVVAIHNGPFSFVLLEKGPWYWVHISYSYLLLTLGAIFFLGMYYKSVPGIRKQILFMFFGGLIPWILNIIYVLGYSPHSIDLMPFGFTLTGIFYIYGIFKFKFLKLMPIALEMVFQSMQDGVIILDIDHNVCNYNDSAQQIIKELDQTIKGKDAYEFVFSNYPELLARLKKEEKEMQVSVEGSDGSKYYDISVSNIENGGMMIGKTIVLRDITEQRALMISLDKLASVDELTQLYNRRHFYEKCEMEMDRARRYNHPISFILFDIDHFKMINDTHGHHMGDLVLKKIAEVCKNTVRLSDLVARHGGEEFAILLPETSCEVAFQTAERLRLSISSSSFEFEGIPIHLTASFGVFGIHTISVESVSDLIAKADKAMYQAKEQGRNQVVMYC